MDEGKEGIDVVTWTEVYIMESNTPVAVYREGEVMMININSREAALADTFHEAMQKKADGHGTATYLVNRFNLATIYGYRLLWSDLVRLKNIEIREITKTSLIKKVRFDHEE